MRRERIATLVRLGVGPLVAFLGAATWGHMQRSGAPFFGAPPLVNTTENAALEGAVMASMANAVWAFGDGHSAKQAMQEEIQRLTARPGPEEARALIRFAILDSNPDGRRALLAQACVADETICADWRPVVLQQTQARFVAPGNRVPQGLGGDHPLAGH